MKQCVLLAVEGVDGAGKRSVCDAISGNATALGLKVQFFTFPDYESPTGVAISNYLSNPDPVLSPDAAAMLFACDRLQVRDELCDALSTSDLVIVDRYVDSNAAYQAARLPEKERHNFTTWVRNLEHGLMAMPRPTITVLLEVSPDESRRRTSLRQGTDRPEKDHYEASMDLLRAAADEYQKLSADPGWSTVQSTGRPLEEVVHDAWSVVQEALK
ncbi:dTMP kinase [Arthrobacter sp. NicSoilB11]|uniref:dTMP kinase n=1 Tax=Arthrobacter sp. NicSoilB11 TaxID=2830999 RepID=UPI001CC5936B|nr:dTMP kinase [Arthrobacter sp. NicSoilB11]BCW77507.1 thymidylate kinase [Arthrobacter sp. NicSoilB11]